LDDRIITTGLKRSCKSLTCEFQLANKQKKQAVNVTIINTVKDPERVKIYGILRPNHFFQANLKESKGL